MDAVGSLQAVIEGGVRVSAARRVCSHSDESLTHLHMFQGLPDKELKLYDGNVNKKNISIAIFYFC